LYGGLHVRAMLGRVLLGSIRERRRTSVSMATRVSRQLLVADMEHMTGRAA
jgi:hypothetical protein